MYRYSVKPIEIIDNGPKALKNVRVGIFRSDDNSSEQIGEYIRNYPLFFKTFFHFIKDSKDYALYSPDYFLTRVMELPSCKDIGGEERNITNLCPNEYYIPIYVDREYQTLENSKRITKKYRVVDPKAEQILPIPTSWEREDNMPINVSLISCFPFGFVSGTYWVKEGPEIIHFLDLSQVEKGIIKRDKRFGKLILPQKMGLSDAIVVEASQVSYETPNISIASERDYQLETGKEIDWSKDK
jgi:hypothetical protein